MNANGSLYPAHVGESHPKRRTLRYANRDEMARRSVSPGIWENWREPASAEIRTFAIITIDSNELVAEIHDRMPSYWRRVSTLADWARSPTPGALWIDDTKQATGL